MWLDWERRASGSRNRVLPWASASWSTNSSGVVAPVAGISLPASFGFSKLQAHKKAIHKVCLPQGARFLSLVYCQLKGHYGSWQETCSWQERKNKLSSNSVIALAGCSRARSIELHKTFQALKFAISLINKHGDNEEAEGDDPAHRKLSYICLLVVGLRESVATLPCFVDLSLSCLADLLNLTHLFLFCRTKFSGCCKTNPESKWCCTKTTQPALKALSS